MEVKVLERIAEPQNYEQASEIQHLTEALENELRLLRGPDGLCLLSYAVGVREGVIAAVLGRRLYHYHHVRRAAEPARKLPLAG